MDIINQKSAALLSFFAEMNDIEDCIKNAMQHRTPHLNGEKFLTKSEVCVALNISERTLQEWRSSKMLPYIKLNGKILYRHSDILSCLERHTVR